MKEINSIELYAIFSGIQWLISNGIMSIPYLSDESIQPETSIIPSWIKINAGWWADGQIDDKAYVTGIQWLVSNGIIKII